MKYMSQSWLEPGINTRLAAQMPAGLSGSSPVPTSHAPGHILEGILGSQAAAHLTHTELHRSSGSGGILGRAGESELDSVELEAPAAPALTLNLSNEVPAWSFLDPVGYIKEKT